MIFLPMGWLFLGFVVYVRFTLGWLDGFFGENGLCFWAMGCCFCLGCCGYTFDVVLVRVKVTRVCVIGR